MVSSSCPSPVNTHSVLLSLEYGKRARDKVCPSRPALQHRAKFWGLTLRDSCGLIFSTENRGWRSLFREFAARINPLAKIFARLEMWNVFSGQRYGFAGLRITANAGRPDNAAKSCQIHESQCARLSRANRSSNPSRCFDCQLNVFRRQVFLLPGDHFNEF